MSTDEHTLRVWSFLLKNGFSVTSTDYDESRNRYIVSNDGKRMFDKDGAFTEILENCITEVSSSPTPEPHPPAREQPRHGTPPSTPHAP